MQAHSRLAALLREVGHAEGTVAALERLAALPGGGAGDAQARLREAQAPARRRAVTNHYKLLGLPRSTSAEEVCLKLCACKAASRVEQAALPSHAAACCGCVQMQFVKLIKSALLTLFGLWDVRVGGEAGSTVVLPITGRLLRSGQHI